LMQDLQDEKDLQQQMEADDADEEEEAW
jgi:hypothetical protein